MELRPFTKFDWYGWAGAERFADGSEPLIGEADDRVVIVDAHGIQVVFTDESTYDFRTPAPKAVAYNIKLDVATPEDLEALGFDRIN